MITDLDFEKTFSFILKKEGGYVNHPNDKGRKTKFGVTESTLNAYRKAKNLPPKSVEFLTTLEAKEIFQTEYWNKVVDKNMDGKYAFTLADLCYNSGVSRAKKYHSIAKGDVDKLIAMRRDFYNRIVKNDPTQKVFLKGWMNRINEVEEYVNAWDLIQF